jgi:hypothetical protein
MTYADGQQNRRNAEVLRLFSKALVYQPCATMASATFVKPAMFAPAR